MSARTLLVAMDPNDHLSGLGRAHRVALTSIENGVVGPWDVIEVKWGEAHELENEGSHHARVAKFVRDRGANEIVASGAGPDMRRMLERLGVRLTLASGPARPAVEQLASGPAAKLSTVH